MNLKMNKKLNLMIKKEGKMKLLQSSVFEFTEVTYKNVVVSKTIESRDYEIEQLGNDISVWFKETFDRDSGYLYHLTARDVLKINGKVVTDLKDFCKKLISES